MRNLLLIPGLLALSAAIVGCGEKAAENDDPAKAAGGTKSAAGEKFGVDASYVLPEAVAALVIHPQQLLKSPLAANDNVKQGMDKAKSTLGVDPATLEQIVISGGPPGDDPGNPVTFVIRFSSPHTGKSMIEKAAQENNPDAEIEEVSYAGKVFYREKPKKPTDDAPAETDENDPFGGPGFGESEPKPLPCVYFPDDKTAVLADEEPLKRVMDAKEAAKTPLTAALAKLEVSGDLVGILVMNDQLRQMAKDAPAPKAGNAFDNLPDTLNQAVISTSLSPKIQVQATLSLKDDQSAGDIDAAIKQSIQDGMASLKSNIAELDKTPKDDQFAQFVEEEKKTYQELQKMISGVSSQKAGSEVIIDVTGLDDVNYKTLMEGPMGMMASMMLGGFGPMGGPPGGDDFGPIEDFSPPEADFNPPDEGPGEPVEELKEADEVEVEVEAGAATDDGN